MITTLLIKLLTFLIGIITTLLPTWQIWPDSLLTGLSYFFTQLLNFNFLFPIDTLLQAIIFLISFETVYFSSKILMKLFNYVRGTGSGVDI